MVFIEVANLPPVSLIPVANLDLQMCVRIFTKNPNDPDIIFRGLGEDDSLKKNLNKKSCDTVPLPNAVSPVRACLNAYPFDWRGFEEAKKKTSFGPLSV